MERDGGVLQQLKTFRAFVVVVSLLFSTSVEAAFTRVSGGANTTGTITTTLTVAVTPGATNRIILVAAGNASTTGTFSIVDTAGNTWTTLNARTTQTGSGAMQSWWALSNGSASTTITITYSVNCAASGFCNVLADVFSGNATASPISSQSTAAAATGAPSGTVTPADANTLLWGAANDSITAVGAGYTKGADDTVQDWSEYKEIAGGSGAAQTVNFSGTSGAWLLHMGSIKPAGGAATPGCTNGLLLLGVGCH